MLFITISIILGVVSLFVVFGVIVTSDNYWKRLFGVSCFIIFALFCIGLGMYQGKLFFRESPLLFAELSVGNHYKIIKFIDNDHALVRAVGNFNEYKSDLILINTRGIPKEITAMKEGETFKVPPTTSKKFMFPMIHPH